MNTADAIRRTLESTNVADSNMEPANVVDVINKLAYSTKLVADAIAPICAPGRDSAGGHVQCLTEAVMGVTAGLFAIADAIRENNNA